MIDLLVLVSLLAACSLSTWCSGTGGMPKAAGKSMAEKQFAIVKHFASLLSAIKCLLKQFTHTHQLKLNLETS